MTVKPISGLSAKREYANPVYFECRPLKGQSIRKVDPNPIAPTEPKWYCIAVGSAAENRVALLIRYYVDMLNADAGFEKYVYTNYLIPINRDIVIMPGNVPKLVNERVIAGYLLIEVKLTAEMYDLIRSVKGVYGFLADQGVATRPVQPRDVQRLVAGMIESGTLDGKRRVNRKVQLPEGTKIAVTAGPFLNFTGHVVLHAAGQIKASVKIFGREMSISFDEAIVERIRE